VLEWALKPIDRLGPIGGTFPSNELPSHIAYSLSPFLQLFDSL